jgi:hypothetical protein
MSKLSDYRIADRKTMDLLNVWFAIMSNRAPREYVEATNEEKGAFYLAVCVEIDERVAAGDQLDRLSLLMRQRIDALEARVEQLENHPAGCSCTRCTG